MENNSYYRLCNHENMLFCLKSLIGSGSAKLCSPSFQGIEECACTKTEIWACSKNILFSGFIMKYIHSLVCIWQHFFLSVHLQYIGCFSFLWFLISLGSYFEWTFLLQMCHDDFPSLILPLYLDMELWQDVLRECIIHLENLWCQNSI